MAYNAAGPGRWYKDAGVFLDLWCFCLRAGYFVVVYMKGRLIIGKIF